MSAKKVKVAVIRMPDYPVGQPAPCYITCLCGISMTMTFDVDMPCECGRVYDSRGWLLKEPTR